MGFPERREEGAEEEDVTGHAGENCSSFFGVANTNSKLISANYVLIMVSWKMIICGEHIIIGSNFFKHQENWIAKRC